MATCDFTDGQEAPMQHRTTPQTPRSATSPGLAVALIALHVAALWLTWAATSSATVALLLTLALALSLWTSLTAARTRPNAAPVAPGATEALRAAHGGAGGRS